MVHSPVAVVAEDMIFLRDSHCTSDELKMYVDRLSHMVHYFTLFGR